MASTWEFWGDTNIQFTAPTKARWASYSSNTGTNRSFFAGSLGSRWQSRRTRVHLLLHKNHNQLLNNHQPKKPLEPTKRDTLQLKTKKRPQQDSRRASTEIKPNPINTVSGYWLVVMVHVTKTTDLSSLYERHTGAEQLQKHPYFLCPISLGRRIVE